MDPTITDTSKFPHEVALMLLYKTLPIDWDINHLKIYSPYHGSEESVSDIEINAESVQPPARKYDPLPGTDTSSTVRIISHGTPEDRTEIVDNVCWEGSGADRYITLNAGQSLPGGVGLAYGWDSIKLSEKDINAWELASTALRLKRGEYSVASSFAFRSRCLGKRSSNFQNVAINVKAVHGKLGNSLQSDQLGWFMLIALPIIYGSVHLAAWNFEFPTYTEKIMWKVACTLIAGGILVAVISFIILVIGCLVLTRIEREVFHTFWLSNMLDNLSELWTAALEIEESFLRRITSFVLLGLSVGIPVALYVGARIFVIVESFISVRREPLGVFLTVNWSTYIPHL
jgi:hypothetical protein